MSTYTVTSQSDCVLVCACADPTDSRPSFQCSVPARSAVPFYLIVRPLVVLFQTLIITLYFAKGRNKMFALVFTKPSAIVVGPREFLPPATTLCSHVLNLNSSLFTVLRVKPMLKWLEDMKMRRNCNVIIWDHWERRVNYFRPWSACCMRTRIVYCTYMNRGKNSSYLLIGRYYYYYY
jgi:hypothetical protein